MVPPSVRDLLPPGLEAGGSSCWTCLERSFHKKGDVLLMSPFLKRTPLISSFHIGQRELACDFMAGKWIEDANNSQWDDRRVRSTVERSQTQTETTIGENKPVLEGAGGGRFRWAEKRDANRNVASPRAGSRRALFADYLVTLRSQSRRAGDVSGISKAAGRLSPSTLLARCLDNRLAELNHFVKREEPGWRSLSALTSNGGKMDGEEEEKLTGGRGGGVKGSIYGDNGR